MISVAGTIFVFIGLQFFKKIISHIVPKIKISKIYSIILFLFFGSNLLHYATYDGIFSHASSFMINSILIYLFLTNLDRTEVKSYAYFLIGFLPIFGATIRLTNITFVLITFLFFTSKYRARDKNKLGFIFIGFIAGSLLLFFQLLVWKITSGSFFYFSYYGYEGFRFNIGNIHKIIFSFNPHGLLPWSPILLLSLLGIIKAFKFNKSFFMVSLIIFTSNAIIFSSWSEPFGGGGYGHRLFIDLFPLLFVALTFSYTFSSKLLNIFTTTYGLFSVLITIFFTYQYWKGEIDFGGISYANYLREIKEFIDRKRF
jgi:hypothetical protein